MENYIFPYKKVLILENECWNENDNSGFHSFYKKLKKDGVEFKIIDQAAGKDMKEIVSALKWCDAMMFSSTFLYVHDVKGLGDLLGSPYFVNDPKVVIGHVRGGKGNLQYYIESIWSLKELAMMSHHKVFELVQTHTSLGEPLKESDMVQYKTKWDKEEDERVRKNHSMPKTGRRVKIGVLEAIGEQWSLLKTGDIVDELDCSSIDPNPSRGTWVMGKDEPVKLLNDSGYEEYEYADLSSENLTLEFFSRGSSKDRTGQMETLQTWIHNCVGCQLNDTDLWEWCDNICKLVGVERRVNRKYFERRLKEYRSKFNLFKEPGLDPRSKRVTAFK